MHPGRTTKPLDYEYDYEHEHRFAEHEGEERRGKRVSITSAMNVKWPAWLLVPLTLTT